MVQNMLKKYSVSFRMSPTLQNLYFKDDKNKCNSSIRNEEHILLYFLLHHNWKMEFEKSKEIGPMLKVRTFSNYFPLKITNVEEKSFICYDIHRESPFWKLYIPLDVIFFSYYVFYDLMM